ncbi:GntR family transcriptional regulator [Devosia beringensis]|uniref:GntR family transcriptional regulator n=1 Tax=Devosia beringensis TaxID=2657486 RepID=UPI00186B8C2A|nr:GntR family transcriptional regulator [Devosia beringensis]
MTAQWFRVYDTLRKAIMVGELRPGSQLPPEFELSVAHNVSRNTVRRAYLALSQDGLIRSVNGRGSFVMQTGITYEVDATSRFRDVLDGQGVRSSMQVLDQVMVPAGTELATSLGVAPDTTLLRVTGLIMGNDIPFILTVRHIRADLVDNLQAKLAETDSLTRIVRNEGLGQLRRVSTTVSARLPTDREADLLQSPANAPILVVGSTGRIDNGQLLECQNAVMNGQVVRLSFRND